MKVHALLKKKTQKQTSSKSLTTASSPQAVHNFPSGINKELVTIDDHNVNDDNSDENTIDSNDVIENNPQHSMDVQLENTTHKTVIKHPLACKVEQLVPKCQNLQMIMCVKLGIYRPHYHPL